MSIAMLVLLGIGTILVAGVLIETATGWISNRHNHRGY